MLSSYFYSGPERLSNTYENTNANANSTYDILNPYSVPGTVNLLSSYYLICEIHGGPYGADGEEVQSIKICPGPHNR